MFRQFKKIIIIYLMSFVVVSCHSDKFELNKGWYKTDYPAIVNTLLKRGYKTEFYEYLVNEAHTKFIESTIEKTKESNCFFYLYIGENMNMEFYIYFVKSKAIYKEKNINFENKKQLVLDLSNMEKINENEVPFL